MQVKKMCANGHHTLIYNINERKPSDYISTNKTIVDWSIQLDTASGWAFELIGSTLNVKFDGVEIYNNYAQRSCGVGITTLASGSKEISHNADGSKSINFSCSYAQSSTSSWTPGNASLSGNLVLTTIPRATTCPNLSGDIESTYNIALNPASSSFSHSLKVTFGAISGYINASGNLQTTEYKFNNKNINFTIPSSFYQQFSGKSGTGILNLTTYNGSNNIGTKKATLTANCLESRCKPSISGSVKDANNATKALTGNDNKIVKGYSNALLTLNIKASTSSGDTKSSISSRSVEGSSFSGTTVTLNKVSKKAFNVTATNSRGFSTTTTISASGELIEYFNPILKVAFARISQTSDQVKLTYSGSFYNKSFGSVSNTLALKWYYRESRVSSWTTGGEITPSITGNNISEAIIDCGTGFDYQTNYRFKLEVIDKLSSGASSVEQDVTAGIPNNSHGKGWFQHHTNIYDKNANQVIAAKDIFPVGSVYITATNTNPQTFLGGTWIQFGQGRTLVGVNTSDTDFKSALKTGGSKTVTLTTEQMPAHTHTGIKFSDKHLRLGNGGSGTTNTDMVIRYGFEGYNAERNNVVVNEAGGGKAHSNVQPYITVYFWRRTA